MAETADQMREVYYSGRVQGVGFRYTVRSLSQRFSVTGFVRNLPDGRVHLIAEGMPAELDGFLDAIRAAMGHHIARAEVRDGEAAGRFASFEIRY